MTSNTNWARPCSERRSRGMTPTAVGAAFLKRARAIMNDIQRAREEAEQIGVAGAAHGTVVAGLSGAAHVAMLPRALTRFRARYPDVQLRMIEGLYPTLRVPASRMAASIFTLGRNPNARRQRN